MKQRTPYDEGYDEYYRSGTPRCPYQERTPEAREYYDGFNDAVEDDYSESEWERDWQ